jgi:hypothetical protein
MTISRRDFIKWTAGAAALTINPSLDFGGRAFSLFRAAHAQWLQAASLAISAYSAFTQSDNGMGAMLANIQQLQLETITLIQNVITQLGQIQAAIAELPDEMHKQFLIVAQYDVQGKTSGILQDFVFVDAESKALRKHTDMLAGIIDKSTSLAGQALGKPYGINAAGAICAPVVAAMDARARSMLNRRAEIPNAVKSYYLPWIRAVRSRQEGSLMNAFIDAGLKYKNDADNLAKNEPALLKQFLPSDFVTKLLAMDPGTPKISYEAACGYYDREVWYEPTKLQPEFPRDYKKVYPVRGQSSFGLGPPIRVIGEPQSAVTRIIDTQNVFVDPADALQPGQEPGPMLQVSGSLTARTDPTGCDKFAGMNIPPFGNGGRDTDSVNLVNLPFGQVGLPSDQMVVLLASDQAQAWDTQVKDFVQNQISVINDDRRIIYSLGQLLVAAKGAENFLAKVSS